MESELMPCPVCGAPCELGDAVELCLDADYAICEGEVCGYSATLERHAELSRRAEIGALVERMMSDPRSVALRFGSAVDLTDGSEYVDAILWYRAAEESGRTQSYGQGGTLLDALRALAKEVGCE